MDEDKKVGRKQRPAPPQFDELYIELVNGNMNRVQACRILECSNAQLNVWLLQQHLQLMEDKIAQLKAENKQLKLDKATLERQVIKLEIMNNKNRSDE